MEGLLARARKPKADGEVCWLPSEPKTTRVAESRPESAVGGFTISADGTISEPSLRSGGNRDEPSHKHDKAAARANLDNLRSVANTAARSAIANYTSRATREKMLFRGLLLAIGLALGAVLLTSAMWGKGRYVILGWVSLASCAALGADLVGRSLLRYIRRSHVSTHLSRSLAADARSKAAHQEHRPKPPSADTPAAGGTGAADQEDSVANQEGSGVDKVEAES
jgi:hypothetical protein